MNLLCGKLEANQSGHICIRRGEEKNTIFLPWKSPQTPTLEIISSLSDSGSDRAGAGMERKESKGAGMERRERRKSRGDLGVVTGFGGHQGDPSAEENKLLSRQTNLYRPRWSRFLPVPHSHSCASSELTH